MSYKTFGKAEIRNLTKVIESGAFWDYPGGFIDQFRNDFAKAHGAKHATAAATAMLLMQAIPGAIGAGAGDEIICDPIVHFSGLACMHNNIVPVWADVRPDNFLMDPKSVEKKITRRTKAIWVTHLWGFAAEVDKLRRIADRHGIYLLEDCAHATLAKYKGKYLGTWGHFGTFSFNMAKQLPTGEGGMAICNDDELAMELNRRIIFCESPEVMSSNYRMTEFQGAVGVEQLKKMPRYHKITRETKKWMDAAMADCTWLKPRKPLPGTQVAPYMWSCLFNGKQKKVGLPVFKAALRQAGGIHFGFGFTQRPAYHYSLFKNPEKYGLKGWPFGYKGPNNCKDGSCPVTEDILQRLIYTGNQAAKPVMRTRAKVLKKAIALAECGTVEPLTYSDTEKKVLAIVKADGPVDPSAVIKVFDKKKWGHFDEQQMYSVMEGLRDFYPYKLSHAGPSKFIYQDLS